LRLTIMNDGIRRLELFPEMRPPIRPDLARRREIEAMAEKINTYLRAGVNTRSVVTAPTPAAAAGMV